MGIIYIILNINSYGCTIEEIIMTSLANDLGDLINPQTTHILFSEFKKLMFLNAMNLKTLEEEKLAEGKPYHKKELKKNVFIGLVAPPILDLVWCILIRTKIYEKFWAQTFKGFLDRHPPTAKIDERKIYDYPVTIKLITNYGALLNPFKNVWPHYDKESMLFDAKWYVTVDSNDLTRIIESAKKKCKTISKSVEDWKKSVQEVSDEHSKANIHKEEKVSAYSSEKIKFENKDKTIKALFSEIELRDSKSNVTKQKLQDKYMINVDTSKAWIKEYYKFIIMLIKDEGAYLPSWKVQAVLNTHAENSEAFRHFSFDLFGKLIYPEDYNIHINDTVEAKNKYKNTLNEYKSLYGASPNSALWEPVYSRFAWVDEENEGEEGKRSQETDKSSSITFSILRYRNMDTTLKTN